MFKRKIFVLILVFFFLAGTLAFAGHSNKQIITEKTPTNKKVELKPYAEGEVLVKFKKGVTFNSVNQIASSKSMKVKKHFKILSKLMGYEYVLMKSAKNTLDMVNGLKKHPAVASVSPNYRQNLDATPDDTRYSELWGMHNTGQTGGTADADIDAPEAWDVNTGSSDVVVAVIDTGLDYNHPDLAANSWVNAAEYSGTAGVDDDGNGYIDDIYGIDPAGDDGFSPDTDPMDGYGHGTHCSGTIGAVGNNSLGVVGVNWNVKIMGLKFFDDTGSNGYTSYAIECIEYAIDQKLNYSQNVVAINASWGGGGFEQTLKDAIEAAGNAGIVFCSSAGNSGSNNDTSPHYPSSYNLSTIIAVTSTDHDDAWDTGTNYGAASVDLGAPGVSILSTVPAAYIPQAGDIFFDDMESGSVNWVHGGTLDTWAISIDQEIFLNPSFPVPSPPNFWSDSPSVDYSANTDSWLALASDIDLSSYVGQDVYLGIGSAMYIEGGYDHGYVELSNDSGANWTSIFDFSGYGYYWSSWTWLIPDSYKTANFRFRFHLTSDSSVQYDGWLIDNVGIGTTITYGYESWSGTSMATPHVTGSVALLAAEYPADSISTRIGKILANVDPNSSLAGRCVTEGRLNVNEAITGEAPAIINVSYPTDGEILYVTDYTDIIWTATGGGLTDVKISYSTNGGATYKDIATVPNTGSYKWTIPDNLTNSGKVKVSAPDDSAYGESDGWFTITYFSPEAGYNDWGYSVVQTQDGGYAFAGITDAFTHGGQDILVYRLDSNGNKVWRKNYGGIRDEFGWWTWAGPFTYGLGCQITNTSDGGFIVIASTESFVHGSGCSDFIVYKIDANGNKQWRKNYGGTSWEFGYSVDQTSDGGYIITGGNFSFTHGACDFLVYKLDANGNKQWRKNYGGVECDRATYIEQTSDGGYIVGGRTRTFVHEGGDCKDFLAYKLDSNGNKQWRKNYGGNWGDAGFTIHQTTDGGYIFAGMTRSFVHDSPGPGWYSADFLIYKLNAIGNKQWRKNLGGEYYEEAYSIVQTSDGGYAVTGYTDTFTHGSSDFLVYKLDSNGNKQWRKNYGGIAPDVARSIIHTNDGGYAIAGQTLSFVHTPGYWDFLLYKVNSSGAKQWRKNYGR